MQHIGHLPVQVAVEPAALFCRFRCKCFAERQMDAMRCPHDVQVAVGHLRRAAVPAPVSALVHLCTDRDLCNRARCGSSTACLLRGQAQRRRAQQAGKARAEPRQRGVGPVGDFYHL